MTKSETYKLGYLVGQEFAKELEVAEKLKRFKHVPMRTKNPHKEGTPEYEEHNAGFREGMKRKNNVNQRNK